MSGKVCSVDGCSNAIRAHGFCPKHLYRWEKYGDPLVANFYQNGHKKNNPKLYKTWQGMKNRCYNKKCISYKHYGGRGIKVCDRWLGAQGFDNFLEDMGEKPSSEYSLDRINTDDDYRPENCRWATWEEQENNRRTNIYYEYMGAKMTLPQWSKKLGIAYGTLLYRRKRGIVPPELFSQPNPAYSRKSKSFVIADENLPAVD